MRHAARAPLRIDLAGGWTCFESHPLAEGGAALGMAIERFVEGHVARPGGEPALLSRFRSERSYLSYHTDVPRAAGLGIPAAESVLWLALLRSVIDNTATRRDVARFACDVN